MIANSFLCHQCVIVLLTFDFFSQVVSEYCGNNKFCQAPYKCCVISLDCCYDHDNGGYTRGFKLHVWNMWYFWLVVIFILMSCFGGCGYYRRRRLAALQQPTTAAPSPRRVCTTRHRRVQPPSNLYVYNGPGADVCSNMALPPPYTEVMQQPNLYPINKTELPPYPGLPGDKDVRQVRQEEEVSPPPYCEVAMPPTQSQEDSSSSVPAERSHPPTDGVSQGQHVSSVDVSISLNLASGSS